MKLYFYSSKININSYLVVYETASSEDTVSSIEKGGILIDPIHINEHLISKIENEGVTLKLVLLTNSHLDKTNHGLLSLKKIYNLRTFFLNESMKLKDRFELHKILNREKEFEESLKIEAFPFTENGSDICMYKIGNMLFTGFSLLKCFLYPDNLSLIEKIEKERIKDFLLSLTEETFCFPLSGPPFTIKTFKFYTNT